jgi:hypothetical protein
MKSILLTVALMIATLGCATTPTGPTENTVDCKTFLGTEHKDRVGQWVNTFTTVMEASNTGRMLRNCVMTVPRVETADILLVRACRDNPDLDFDVAVEASLEHAFAQCGLTLKPLSSLVPE